MGAQSASRRGQDHWRIMAECGRHGGQAPFRHRL